MLGAIAEKYLYKEFGCVVVAWVDSIMEIRLPEDIRDGFKSRPPTREEVDAFGRVNCTCGFVNILVGRTTSVVSWVIVLLCICSRVPYH